jgi:hypothetical protein
MRVPFSPLIPLLRLALIEKSILIGAGTVSVLLLHGIIALFIAYTLFHLTTGLFRHLTFFFSRFLPLYSTPIPEQHLHSFSYKHDDRNHSSAEPIICSFLQTGYRERTAQRLWQLFR